MEKENRNNEILSLDELLKVVQENINRLDERIKSDCIIKVSDYRKKGKTAPSIKQFLKDKCKFRSEEFSGLYLFFNPEEMASSNSGLYTGISRNLVVRLKDHVSGGDPSVASFAVILARDKDEELDKYLSSRAYKSAKSIEEIKEKEKYKERLKYLVDEIQKFQMANMYLSAIPINNYQELHATEAIVASAFNCKFNSFKTH